MSVNLERQVHRRPRAVPDLRLVSPGIPPVARTGPQLNLRIRAFRLRSWPRHQCPYQDRLVPRSTKRQQCGDLGSARVTPVLPVQRFTMPWMALVAGMRFQALAECHRGGLGRSGPRRQPPVGHDREDSAAYGGCCGIFGPAAEGGEPLAAPAVRGRHDGGLSTPIATPRAGSCQMAIAVFIRRNPRRA